MSLSRNNLPRSQFIPIDINPEKSHINLRDAAVGLASTEIPQATAGAVLQEHVEIPGDGKTLGKPWENVGKTLGKLMDRWIFSWENLWFTIATSGFIKASNGFETAIFRMLLWSTSRMVFSWHLAAPFCSFSPMGWTLSWNILGTCSSPQTPLPKSSIWSRSWL